MFILHFPFYILHSHRGAGRESLAQDPKPGELTMGRVKGAERRLEARTITCRKKLG